jgi:hypothetical protein
MTRAHVDRAGLPVCGCGHRTRLAETQHRQKPSRREQRVITSKPRPRRSAVKAKPAKTVPPPPAGRTKREAALIAEGKQPFKGAMWFGPAFGYGYKPASNPYVQIHGRAALTPRRIDPKYGVQVAI